MIDCKSGIKHFFLYERKEQEALGNTGPITEGKAVCREAVPGMGKGEDQQLFMNSAPASSLHLLCYVSTLTYSYQCYWQVHPETLYQ